jgi:inorganic pyrophosphatase
LDSPDKLEVTIEVPSGGFVKRRDDGGIDYVSPFRCPFNYGSVEGTVSGDGDRLDAVVLGPSLPRGTRALRKVRGLVQFVDAGLPDPKYVCSDAPLSDAERRLVDDFFRRYGLLKGLLNRLRGKRGRTAYDGFVET